MPQFIKTIAFLILLTAAPLVRAEILVKAGQAIGFMGDSITEQGAAPSGYVGLVTYALKVEGAEIKALPAGVSGHTSGNMKARTKPQIIDAGANWMTLSCGVNDVMMQAKGRGVELDKFKENIKFMVEACEARGIKVVLLTPTPLGEDLTNESNQKLAGYVEFMRAYAKEKRLLVADNNEAFATYLKTPAAPGEKAGARLLADGIHPNQIGQNLMATTLLATLGVPAADMPKIEKAWLDNPRGKSVKVGQGTQALISQGQFKALEDIAGKKHTSPAAIVATLWKDAGSDPQVKIGELVDAYIAKEGK